MKKEQGLLCSYIHFYKGKGNVILYHIIITVVGKTNDIELAATNNTAKGAPGKNLTIFTKRLRKSVNTDIRQTRKR